METGLWTRIYLVRHGEVDAAWQARIYGDLDVPLSERGKEQAAEAARRLADRPFARVVSSDLSRAYFGAECIRAGRQPAGNPEIDRRWREVCRGSWAGRTFAELEQQEPGAFAGWLADPARIRPPGGENLTDVAERLQPAIAGLLASHPGAEVAVVAHGWVMRVLIGRCLGLRGAAVARLVIPPGSIAALDYPRAERDDPPGSGGGDQHPPPRPILVGFGLDVPLGAAPGPT